MLLVLKFEKTKFEKTKIKKFNKVYINIKFNNSNLFSVYNKSLKLK